MKVDAPAKINLSLEVLGRRPDGYHEIISVAQAVSLSDTLTCSPSVDLEVQSSVPSLQNDHNLVLVAARALRQRSGVRSGARIQLEKRIPVGAGLGGGSADAAAAIRCLLGMWNIEMSDQEQQLMGAEIGSDVAFFLTGTTALMEGRGEKTTPLGHVPPAWLVLCNPGFPSSTRAVYAAVVPADFSDGASTRAVAQSIMAGGRATVGVNGLEGAARRRDSSMARFLDHVQALVGSSAMLCGSGSSVFSLARDRDEAESRATSLRKEGYWACAACTL